jgi:hypothetical protein
MNPTTYAWTRYYFYDPPAPGSERDRFAGEPVFADVYTPPKGATSRPDLLAVAVLDLADPRAVDTAFGQLADQIAETERDAAPKCEGVLYSVLAFGLEPRDLRAEQTHAAYNRMWDGHRELWEAVQARELPVCLWLVDGSDRPFHGVIQPALHGDFEIWSSADVRKGELYTVYRARGGPWRAMLMPLGADVLGRAQAHVRSQRGA